MARCLLRVGRIQRSSHGHRDWCVSVLLPTAPRVYYQFEEVWGFQKGGCHHFILPPAIRVTRAVLPAPGGVIGRRACWVYPNAWMLQRHAQRVQRGVEGGSGQVPPWHMISSLESPMIPSYQALYDLIENQSWIAKSEGAYLCQTLPLF